MIIILVEFPKCLEQDPAASAAAGSKMVTTTVVMLKIMTSCSYSRYYLLILQLLLPRFVAVFVIDKLGSSMIRTITSSVSDVTVPILDSSLIAFRVSSL